MKVSEVRGEGGTLLTQAQGQVSRASDVQPSPPPDSPIINGSSVKGWSVHIGIGAHRARLAALRESVGFLGEFGSRNRESSVRHNWGRRRHKAAAHERPNRGRDDESPSRAEQRKNNDATTTHPPNRPLPNAASTKGWHFVPYVTPPEKWLFSDSCPNLLSDARIAPRCTVSPRTAPTRTASLSPIDGLRDQHENRHIYRVLKTGCRRPRVLAEGVVF